MLALILKDIYNSRRTWLACGGMTTLSLLLSEYFTSNLERKLQVAGFVEGLVIAGSMLFVQEIVTSERQKKHLILLKSLPISNHTIILGKLLAVLILSLSLLNLPFIMHHLSLINNPIDYWVVLQVAQIVYCCFLIFFSISFRSYVVMYIPLYIMLIIFIFSDTDFVSRILEQLSDILKNPALLACALVGISILLIYLTIRIFERRELDF